MPTGEPEPALSRARAGNQPARSCEAMTSTAEDEYSDQNNPLAELPALASLRNARPNEVPPLPQLEREIPLPRLGCEISLDKDRTVIVEYVYPGSFGERIGLTRFMKILEVNGTPIHSAADYDKASRLLGGRLRLLVQQRGLDYPEMIQYGF
jgi:hypothetical protein